MKAGSRSFTTKEKVLLVILVILLIGMLYYWFVDQPVRKSIAASEAARDAAQAELDSIQGQIDQLRKMQEELDNLEDYSYMASYNNSAEELSLLNEILSDAIQYNISFSDVTRTGDQIRRNFSIQLKAANYDAMRELVERLCSSDLRCLVGDLRCTVNNENPEEPVDVSASATFYETMVGGTADAGLPVDSALANAN